MKQIFFLFLSLLTLNAYSQTPLNDKSWIKDNYYSDDFNLSRKSFWANLTGSKWGIGIFRNTEIKFASENGKQYLKLNARAENGVYYTGGIIVPGSISPFGYGYYEIEARVSPVSGIQTGIWPAFWTHRPNYSSAPYIYDEIDIFEPGACEVIEGIHHVGSHYAINSSIPCHSPDYDYNRSKHHGYFYDLDMTGWHRYAIEWLPDRLVFYLDGEPFYRIHASEGKTLPTLQNPNLYIDLQIQSVCSPSITNGYLGSFDINLFGYYELNLDCITVVNDIGNFNTYEYAVKKSISLGGATTIPTNSKITLRATDFLQLNAGFEIPLGSEFVLYQSDCN